MGGKEIAFDSEGLKLPPHNLEAERAVLGSMLLSSEAVGLGLELLSEESFYDPAHRKVFSTIKSLFLADRPIDLVTVSGALKDAGQLEQIGGMPMLTDLTDVVPATSNVRHYAEIVRAKYILRRLIEASSNIMDRCYEFNVDASDLLDVSEQMIFEIAQEKEKGSEVISSKDIIKQVIARIDDLYKRQETVTGLPTGLIELDKLTSGLHPGDLIIVAARPSMGKSALATTIAEHIAVERGVPVAIFSIEMSAEQVMQRMLCSLARVDAHKVRTGFLSTSDWPKLTMAAGKLSEAPIYIDDSSGISVVELRAKARRMKSRYNIGLVIVDYLQIMKGVGRVESRQQEISQISRSLKLLAKELSLPVLAISQLSREVERREDKRPRLADLRESGSLEQDADLVIMLMREEYYYPTEENRGRAELIVAKHRNGPTGVVQLAFIKEYARFENLAPEYSGAI